MNIQPWQFSLLLALVTALGFWVGARAGEHSKGGNINPAPGYPKPDAKSIPRPPRHVADEQHERCVDRAREALARRTLPRAEIEDALNSAEFFINKARETLRPPESKP